MILSMANPKLAKTKNTASKKTTDVFRGVARQGLWVFIAWIVPSLWAYCETNARFVANQRSPMKAIAAHQPLIPLPSVICNLPDPPVPQVTGRSHSACDSIRFLAIDARRIHSIFICRRRSEPLMDEVDGKPGHVALQSGHLDAPMDALKSSLCPPILSSPANCHPERSAAESKDLLLGLLLGPRRSFPSLKSRRET